MKTSYFSTFYLSLKFIICVFYAHTNLFAQPTTWDSSTSYITGDIVVSGESSYIATAGSTNQIPPNTTFWTDLTVAATELGVPVEDVSSLDTTTILNALDDAQAQSPSLVNFRGQLLDSNGQPVTSTVTIDLRVFPSESGGTQLYIENIGNVEVRNGLYAFQFGSNGSPDFTSVIRQNSETWVEITLNGDVLPRQRFVSVPYALSAGNAQVSPGSITRDMLSQDVQLDLNQTTNVAPGSVTTSMLSDTILKYLKPEITLQPSFAGTVRNGTNVELSPGVEGKYVTYQWYKDGAPIDGATSQLFTVESFDAGTHDGNYSLLVSNDFGVVETTVVELVEQQSNNQNLGNIFPSFLSDWTDLSNSQAVGSFYGVAIGENAIVACGIDGLIAVRNHESGIWETPVSGGDPDFRDVVFADNKFIAVGESGMIRTSQDGYSWTTVTSNPSYDLRCIVWDGGKFIIGASGGRILKSYDGTNWEATDTGHSITFNAIAYNGSAYIAVGGYGMVYSSDLINWSVPTSPPPSFSIESAAWTGDRFLVGGLNDKIYQSTDGQNWTVAFSHNGGFAESISSNGGATYVVGGSNFILSYDSESGNFVESNTDLDGNNALMDVSINGPNIVAVGFNHTIIGKSLHIQPSTHTADLNSTVDLEMIWVEPGTFTMGSPTTEAGRSPDETEHNVTLTKGFYLGKYEVTQAQYEAVMTGNTDGLDATPSYFSGYPNRPVEQVSHDDIQIFLSRLNTQQSANIPAGWEYILPTESQWEYACRAGTSTAYSWGDDINATRANYFLPDLNQTRDVGYYAANPWGFFDMHGNVREWTADWYDATYPVGNPVIDPTGGASGFDRILRGGSWYNVGTNLRSAERRYYTPSYRDSGMSFRVAFQYTGERMVDLNSTVDLEMIWVEPGTFTMGSPTTEAGRGTDETEHNVTLTKGFYLGKYEVTQAQYEAVMTGNTDGLSATPGNWPGNPNRPVEQVSWDDVQVFLSRLNNQQSANIPAGWEYVLPTESQWEYACRAGTTTMYSWGDDINATRAHYGSSSSLSQTRDVGNYEANPWGFFDMHGNVWEWTADWFSTYPAGNPVIDPTGGASGTFRVFRGGSWVYGGSYLRSAKRDYVYLPSRRDSALGFRLAYIYTGHKVDLNSTVDLEMLWVEPGTFTMGSPITEVARDSDETEHNVTLTKGFYLGKYEVTQAQYEAVMTGNTDGLSATPSNWPGNPNRPVEQVSPADIQIFLSRLNAQQSGNIPEGWEYVLPTESQWEYACRAGTSTMYSWGNDINSTLANYLNSGPGQTTEVGQYTSNPWGFFDMHGNVWEWTADWYDASYPVGNPVIDPTGGASGSGRVARGGSWFSAGAYLRSADRLLSVMTREYDKGFRLAYMYTGERTVDLNSTVDLEMIWVEPGTFTMGSPTTEVGRNNDETEHNVTLTKGFYLGKYEVTQAQYQAVMTGNTETNSTGHVISATPSNWHGNPSRPVERVSWDDIQVFLDRLNDQQSGNIPTGWEYVLPTESQWEYACRAGTTTMYSWGNDINSTLANYLNSGPGQTTEAGQYTSNPWGFFDMHGNVWEWTADGYGTYPTGNPVIDPTGETSVSNRVRRGGGWEDNDGALQRSARRVNDSPSIRYSSLGFRVGFQKQ